METTNVEELRNKESTVKLKLDDWSLIGVSLTYILDGIYRKKVADFCQEWTPEEALRLFGIAFNIHEQHRTNGHMGSIEKIIRNKI